MGRGTGARNTKDRLTEKREKAAYKNELAEIYQESDLLKKAADTKDNRLNGSSASPKIDLENGPTRERLNTALRKANHKAAVLARKKNRQCKDSQVCKFK